MKIMVIILACLIHWKCSFCSQWVDNCWSCREFMCSKNCHLLKCIKCEYSFAYFLNLTYFPEHVTDGGIRPYILLKKSCSSTFFLKHDGWLDVDFTYNYVRHSYSLCFTWSVSLLGELLHGLMYYYLRSWILKLLIYQYVLSVKDY